jgi:hypothetical protein
MGSTGNRYLAGIINDVGTLQHVTGTTHRVMLIFSANPATETSISVKYLSDELSATFGVPLTKGQNFEVASFPTSSDDLPDAFEFWVGGISV